VRDRIIAVRHAQRIVPGLTVTADLIASETRDDAAAKARVLAAGGPEAAAGGAGVYTRPSCRRLVLSLKRGIESRSVGVRPEKAETVFLGTCWSNCELRLQFTVVAM